LPLLLKERSEQREYIRVIGWTGSFFRIIQYADGVRIILENNAAVNKNNNLVDTQSIDEKNKKIEISVYFITYLCVLLIAFFNECCRFLNFSIGYSVFNDVNGIITSFFATGCLLLLLRKHIRLIFPRLNLLDIISFAIIMGYFLLKLPFPDSSFDTRNYHLYLQEMSFSNLFKNNYYPGFYSTFYSLGDSAFFVFRFLLGYRLGIIPNLLVLITLYSVIKQTIPDVLVWLGINDEELRAAFTFRGRSLLGVVLSISAFLVISCEYIFANLNTYWIDVISLPLLIEPIRISSRKVTSKKEIFYLGLCLGLSLAIKVINIIPAALILSYLLWNNRSLFRWRYFAIIATAMCVPISIYAIYNQISMGSPIFPLYNGIFRSVYFPATNYKDTRWGPSSTVEVILWPIMSVIDGNRIGELLFYSGRLALGYIFSILFICISIFVDKLKKLLPIALVCFANVLLWSFAFGYIRYGLYAELVSGLFIIIAIFCVFINFKKLWERVFTGIVIFTLVFQAADAHYILISKNLDWVVALRPSIYSAIKTGTFSYYIKNYIQNAKLIFRDRPGIYLSDRDKQYVDQVDAWFIPGLTSGYSALLKKAKPFILGHDYAVDQSVLNSDRKFLNEQNDVYTVVDTEDINLSMDSFSTFGLGIKHIEYIFPDFNLRSRPLLLIALEKQEIISKSYYVVSGQQVDIPIESNEESFEAYYAPLYTDNSTIEATLIHEDKATKLAEIEINPRDVTEIDLPLNNVDKVDSQIRLKIVGNTKRNVDSGLIILQQPEENASVK
jgi:hypothetical protein